VLPLVATATDGQDLYAGCTLAEVYLLQRNVDAAAAQYQKVIVQNPTAVGDLSGTRQQAERICTALALPPEESAKVLAPFELLDE